MSIATSGTFVHSDSRIVATVGVHDLVIVDTRGRGARCASRSPAARQGSGGRTEGARPRCLQLHRTVARPWGTYTVLQEGGGFKIKRIEVRPGAALSLQLHHRRSEHWVVVAGRARVTRGSETFDLEPNQSTYIPVETRHRLENPGSEPLQMIEVQCGDYVGEDDIVRFDDRYGRIGSPRE